MIFSNIHSVYSKINFLKSVKVYFYFSGVYYLAFICLFPINIFIFLKMNDLQFNSLM